MIDRVLELLRSRQYVALKIYDHYLQSRIMGDDGVAVHLADARSEAHV